MSEKKRSAKEFFMDNNKKNLKIFIIVVVAILVLAAVTMGIYVFAKVGLINIDKDGKVDPDYTLAPEDEFDNMYDATDTSGLDALITAWAKNGGEKYSSKNVINVLLIGVDDAESNRPLGCPHSALTQQAHEEDNPRLFPARQLYIYEYPRRGEKSRALLQAQPFI